MLKTCFILLKLHQIWGLCYQIKNTVATKCNTEQGIGLCCEKNSISVHLLSSSIILQPQSTTTIKLWFKIM